jgi:N-acetylneuraminic acid mutarotase
MTARRSFSFFFIILSLPFIISIAACGGGGGGTPAPTPTPTPTPSTAKEWTWMNGSNIASTSTSALPGLYGTLGTPAAGNVPGGRSGVASWTDSSGNLWLFGGSGFDSAGSLGNLNDLWEFNATSKEWTWVSGANSVGNAKVGQQLGQAGIYGALGTPAAGNIPGGRQGAASWIDSSGNFWLFGGSGIDSAGNQGLLNDLWEFSPATKEWTWASGVSTFPNPNVGQTAGQAGIYGNLSVSASGNTPGGRSGAVSWIDSSGDLWLFGGEGYASNQSSIGYLNDLWRFDPTAKTWTWMSGSSSLGVHGGQPGVYGTLGVPAAGNVPGGRGPAASWIDSSGNFWLFGGYCFDVNDFSGFLNDLWEFNPASKEWTWVNGSDSTGGSTVASGVYGTLGVAATGNVPSGRIGTVSWKDTSGNLWLFGGDVSGGLNNDLWEFNLTSKEWTWVGGVNAEGTQEAAPGIYGTLGVPASANIPEGRDGAVGWIDSSGDLWLFGGASAYGNTGGLLNDLWRYQP